MSRRVVSTNSSFHRSKFIDEKRARVRVCTRALLVNIRKALLELYLSERLHRKGLQTFKFAGSRDSVLRLLRNGRGLLGARRAELLARRDYRSIRSAEYDRTGPRTRDAVVQNIFAVDDEGEVVIAAFSLSIVTVPV